MEENNISEQSSFDLQKFSELLADICTIDPRIDKVIYTFQEPTKASNIECDFLLIKASERDVREEDFMKLLLGSIVRFTLKYMKTHPTSRNPTPKEVNDSYLLNMSDLLHEAKNLFIEKLSKTTSEFGELFLFMLLENKGIVQLLNKMSLKTSSDMPIHGLDAIHIGVKETSLVFYYGYSKIYEKHTDAIRDAVEEAKVFSTDQKRREREFDLVTNYIDKDKFKDFSDKIVEMISPYASDKSFVAESYSILLGYHWPQLDNPKCPASTKLDPYLVSEYLKTVKRMEESIQQHIETWSDSNNYDFIVWTLPLPKLEAFRVKFVDRLKSL
jgi:hypothetical protein